MLPLPTTIVAQQVFLLFGSKWTNLKEMGRDGERKRERKDGPYR